MKKTLLITTALLLTVMAFAQGNRQGFQRPDEATMVKMRTERMAQQLGLDEAQTAKLLELNQKYPNAMMGGPGGPGMGRPARETRNDQNVTDENTTGKKAKKAKKAKKTEGETNDREARMKEIQASQEAYETELKGILTEEQFKTWQEFRNRRPEGRGPGGPGGQGRPGGRGGFGQGGNFGGGGNYGGGFGGGEEF